MKAHKIQKINKKTIIYINFSPYENTGKILDYIIKNFESILLFSFSFHKLKGNKKGNTLSLYKKGKIIKQYRLHTIPTHASLIFFTLPLRSLIIFIQVLWYTFWLKKEYGTFEILFTVNAFTAWTGNILKSLGLVKKTIFWVWDYYPPKNKDKMIALIRWLYWFFDKSATKNTDHVIFLNARLIDLRKKIGIIKKTNSYPIVPIGVLPKKIVSEKKASKILGFIGVLKETQGLDLIIDSFKSLQEIYPEIKLEIIGSGPDENYFRAKAKSISNKIIFRGLILEENNQLEKIISNWSIGLAPYVPGEGNVSYFGDPSKIKLYLGQNLPIITTDVFFSSKEIEKSRAGIIIPYKKESLIKAINNVFEKRKWYEENSNILAKQYDYKKLYKKLFE